MSPSIEEHIINYANNHYKTYEGIANELRVALSSIRGRIAPHALVETRPKSVSSFADKISRKHYADPFKDLTDLCGGRIIAHTTAQVEALAEAIKAEYRDKIDPKNSVDHTQRLKSAEFGYRSVHYVIWFKQPNSGPRVEVQIRTLLEHAWADISHVYAYKSNFPIPALWQRETFRAAALLENVDTMFARMQKGIEQYRVSYGAYMTPTQIREKICLLQKVLGKNGTTKSECENLALTIGRLSTELDDKKEWENAIASISNQLTDTNPGLHLQLGVLRCMVSGPQEDLFKKGQDHLKRALELSSSDVEALVSLAYTYEQQGDDNKAREIYKKAFGLDSSNPRVLTSHLCWEIKKHGNSEMVRYVQPLIRQAIAWCQDQIDMRINLPWAFYDLGLLHLLLEEKMPSFNAYSKAVQMSGTEYIIKRHITYVEKLSSPKEHKIQHVDTTLRFLRLSVELKFGKSSKPIKPVVIISHRDSEFDKCILKPFEQQIDIKEAGSKLPLEMWEGIRDKRTSPKHVKLLGFGGNEQSGEEYQMALALGAWVGLVRGTGGQADEVLADKDWNQTEHLLSLPQGAETIQAFIIPDSSESSIPKEGIQKIAEAIHENYRSQRFTTSDSSLLPWEKLSESMKRSSLNEAKSLASRFETLGYHIQEKSNTTQKSLPEDHRVSFAKMRHGRWNIERLKDGWTLGPKNEAEKKSPYLLSWDDLDEEVRKWNCDFAKDIPEILAGVNLEVYIPKKSWWLLSQLAQSSIQKTG
ncbi:hypothetical protein F4821DRAFT_278357 [Hypoxylon rubiginosum]|uniref:Uncharacterized protein n=1 Tax=Hypoxylon rubiginosum TaxID=110542 RepID=A0ACC0D1X5_9PEZI|nr:hypothetical protein F4821DRAFT_278357 [Hypoxylon rubiginosum]